ncbi:MAG TPA: hypothetical protein VE967_08015 [Gemmatimonadaceae bacterium]|nr:hypothetical protein [Gemmatimonadaceae bacterium]
MRPLLLLATLFCAGGTAACVRSEAQSRTPRLVWSGDTIDAHARLLRDAADSTHGEMVLKPVSARSDAGVLLISDLGSDRVAVLDSNANVMRWIGAHGRGPGELYGAAHIAADSAHVFVAEALGGRVSEFTIAGRFVRAFSSPFGAGAIVAEGGDTYVAARSYSHYADRLRADAEPSPALRRAIVRGHGPGQRWRAMPGHDLLASADAAIWTFDQATLELCTFASAAAHPRCLALPRDLERRIDRYRDTRVAAVEKATRLEVKAAPVAKDMIGVGHRLALLLPLPDLPVVVVDPADGSLTPVVFRGASAALWVRSARTFAWTQGAFVLAGDDGIGRLELASPLR